MHQEGQNNRGFVSLLATVVSKSEYRYCWEGVVIVLLMLIISHSWIKHLLFISQSSQPFTQTHFRVSNSPHLLVFGLWEEEGEPGENPRRRRENKLHTERPQIWNQASSNLAGSQQQEPLHKDNKLITVLAGKVFD